MISGFLTAAQGPFRRPELWSLDAIHLITAQELRDSLSRVVTYDHRLAAAASYLGWRDRPHLANTVFSAVVQAQALCAMRTASRPGLVCR